MATIIAIIISIHLCNTVLLILGAAIRCLSGCEIEAPDTFVCNTVQCYELSRIAN